MHLVADELITTHQVFIYFQKERKSVIHPCLKLKRFIFKKSD